MHIPPGQTMYIPLNDKDVILRGPPRGNIIAVVTPQAVITKRSAVTIEIPIQGQVSIRCDEVQNERGRREYHYRFSR